MVQYVNYISSVWADIILLVTLQNSLFLIGIFAALYFLRNHSIRLRRLIAIVGLAKLFIPPFISIPVLSGGYSVAHYFTVFTVYEMDALASQPLRDASLSVKSLVMIGWGVGTAALLIIVLFNILRMQVIIRNAEPVIVNAQKNQKNRNIVYLKSDKVLSPAAFGLFKRRILLPDDWDSWQKPHKEIIVAHETSHFAIYDNWINLFMVIAASVYFYNPLTWLLYNRLKYYNEITCDNSAVQSANLTPNAYSANLVSIAEIIARPVNKFSPAPSFLSSEGNLSKRITYQLSKKKGDEMENSSKYFRLSTIVAITAILPFSWYCSEEQIVSQEDSVQAHVDEVIQEEEIPKFLPFENQPRPIGGIEAIQSKIKYPEIARKAGIQGQVVIHVLVDEKGIPSELKILRSAGHEELDEAAIEAVKKTRFTPAIHEGKAVKFWMAIPIKFQLASKE